MISLLVTFFLMMMTFSTSNQHNMTEAGVGLLKGRGGVWKNSLAFPAESVVDIAQLGVFSREVCALMSVPGGGQPMTVKPIQDGFTIVVEGYTDSLFKPTRFYSDDIAMGLSRAREAAAILLDGCAIPPERVFVSSFGSLRPRASNDTPSGRKSNRRVELRIVPTIRRSTPSGPGQFESIKR